VISRQLVLNWTEKFCVHLDNLLMLLSPTEKITHYAYIHIIAYEYPFWHCISNLGSELLDTEDENQLISWLDN